MFSVPGLITFFTIGPFFLQLSARLGKPDVSVQVKSRYHHDNVFRALESQTCRRNDSHL